ncbi:SDR family oxidoreductase [Ostreiculturibacter nitratireducens]|uniref:SDR family oxidoreductase n=1 Tax=Ostreiculturibacter nitratireducens TaxID=3075226 RepID=UPI0031B5EBD0
MSKTLLSLGHGYSARALSRRLIADGWTVIGTTRSPEKAAAIAAEGVEPLIWPGMPLAPALDRASHVLSSIGPGEDGDPVVAALSDDLAAAAPHLEWVGYLSTTAVYGDHEGDWVDENTPLAPASRRGALRVQAEGEWQALAARSGLPLHIFRLAGIYGPGRGPFAKLRDGSARRIVKPGQVFSRIHVDDIAQALTASMNRPVTGAIYNLCDDEPAPPQDVIGYAADLLGIPRPPEVSFDEADLSPMARSFYGESKRVRNDRIKRDLGLRLIHPTYREGLAATLAAEAAH